jgi:bisphosphoglycerate-independent phosphoglycerate mutase (AlkP superfamily)
MYKITNKLTGFIQYRNSNEVADFIIMNSKKNTFYDLYKIEKVKEIDTEKYEEITYAILGGVCLSILITLFYFISL